MLAIFAALDFLRYLKEIKDHEVIIDQDFTAKPGHLTRHPYFNPYSSHIDSRVLAIWNSITPVPFFS